MERTSRLAAFAATAGICTMLSGCLVAAVPAGAEYYVGDADYYGAIPVTGYSPNVWNTTPMYTGSYPGGAPIYLRVPDQHRYSWSMYCGYYDACNRLVYFVRDDWYRTVYTPAYRRHHPQPYRPSAHSYRPHHRPGPGTEHFGPKHPPKHPAPGFGPGHKPGFGPSTKPMPPIHKKPGIDPNFTKPTPPGLTKPLPPSHLKPIPKPMPSVTPKPMPKPMPSPSFTKTPGPSFSKAPKPMPGPSFSKAPKPMSSKAEYLMQHKKH